MENLEPIQLNKIYNENHLVTMARMPDGFVDLTVTSPPYDDMDFEFNVVQSVGLREYNGYTWDFKRLANELFRVTKDGGVVVWVVNDPTVDGSESVASALQKVYFRKVGFDIFDTMLYRKNGPAYPSKDKYYQVFEYVFVLSKGKPKTVNLIADRRNRWVAQKWSKKRTRRTKSGELTEGEWSAEQGGEFGVRFNDWLYNTGAGYSTTDELAFKHPATFPEQLAADHVFSWSKEGDVVFDPFLGSGTTVKVAHQQKRNWVGAEISKEYFDLAEKRLEPYLTQLTLF